MREIQEKARHFERAIRRRDRLEMLAALLVAPLFLLFAYHASTPLERIGYLLVAAGAALIILVLRLQRPRLPAFEMNVRQFADALLREYDRQIRLLKNVKYWYLLPPYVGLVLVSIGPLTQGTHSHAPALSIFMLLVVTAVFAWVWWLNEVRGVRLLRAERERLSRLLSEE